MTVAGVDKDGPAKCSRDVVIQSDMNLSEAVKKGPYDVVVLPGGALGTKTFSDVSIVLYVQIYINLFNVILFE